MQAERAKETTRSPQASMVTEDTLAGNQRLQNGLCPAGGVNECYDPGKSVMERHPAGIASNIWRASVSDPRYWNAIDALPNRKSAD